MLKNTENSRTVELWKWKFNCIDNKKAFSFLNFFYHKIKYNWSMSKYVMLIKVPEDYKLNSGISKCKKR